MSTDWENLDWLNFLYEKVEVGVYSKGTAFLGNGPDGHTAVVADKKPDLQFMLHVQMVHNADDAVYLGCLDIGGKHRVLIRLPFPEVTE